MARIKGITVTLYDKVSVGVDSFNHELFKEIPIEVENFLVAPVTSANDDITGTAILNGKHAAYQLAILKSDMHCWDDRTIEFFGEKWHSIGFSTVGIESMIPLDWNRKVMVERYG